EFLDYAMSLSEVEFAFASGASVWTVLRSPDDVERVQRALEAFAASLAILDLRLAAPLDLPLRGAMSRDLIARLHEHDAALHVMPLTVDPAENGTSADLFAAREAIARLSELSTQELRSRLLEAADLVESMANGLKGESSDDE